MFKFNENKIYTMATIVVVILFVIFNIVMISRKISRKNNLSSTNPSTNPSTNTPTPTGSYCNQIRDQPIDIIAVGGQSNMHGAKNNNEITDRNINPPNNLFYADGNGNVYPYKQNGIGIININKIQNIMFPQNSTISDTIFNIFAVKYAIDNPSHKVIVVLGAIPGSSVVFSDNQANNNFSPHEIWSQSYGFNLLQSVKNVKNSQGSNARVKAFLWHQGESDNGGINTPYHIELKKFFSKARVEWPCAKIIAGLLPALPNPTWHKSIIDGKNGVIIDATKNVGGFIVDMNTNDGYCSIGLTSDNIHFSISSYRKLGNAYYEAYIKNSNIFI